MNVAKKHWWWYSDAQVVEEGFSGSMLYTVGNNETEQFPTVPFQSGMNVDYSDVRFVINPNGTGKEKFYLDYELLSTDGSNGYFKVGHPSWFTSGHTFYAIYGKSDAVSKSHPRRTAFAGRWLTNNFDLTARYDVSNVMAAFDTILDGAADGSQEANWSCITQNPINQTNWGAISDSDYNKVLVGYKYDDIDNIHAGSPTSKSAMKVTTDFAVTWSSRKDIYNPDLLHRSTSSTLLAIPTVGSTEVIFTIEAGRAWQVGDIARAFADGTHYFWFTVTDYTGTTLTGTRLSNTGTGTFSSWVISQRLGSTNTVITRVKKPDTVVRTIAVTTKYDFYNSILRIVGTYSDDDGDTWSTPVQVGPDSWINVGGQACTMHNGVCLFTAHENAVDTAEYYSTVIYTRDYGVTWGYVRTVAVGNTKLDETDLRPLKDANGEWTNTIRATCRNEDTAGSNHQYKYLITVTDVDVTTGSIAENDWYDSTVSRYTSCRAPNDTIFYGGGDATGKMVYTTDEGVSFHPIPFPILTTSAVSARRVYITMACHPDGRMIIVWSSNKQPNGSTLYINYFDWTLNQLYVDTANTLTVGTGVRNRPTDLSPGIRIGEWLIGYRTSSTTSISVPTGAGQQRTLTVAAGLSYVGSELVSIVYTTNNGVRFTATVISYVDNVTSGDLTVEWISNTGTGTQATWQINIGTSDNTGNLLASQAYLTIPKVICNPQLRPMKATFRVASEGTGGVTGGFWGMKKFETRALAVITITNAGAAGDTITIRWKDSGAYSGLFGGMGILATYTVLTGDDIADVVTGLVNSFNLIGICPVSASDATTVTVRAPFGNNTAINGLPLTVEVTGTVAGSSGNFASGAAIESSTSLSNIITWDNANNVTRIEQANDNYSAAFTVNNGPANYIAELDTIDANVTDGTTSRTKLPSDSSGLPNYELHGEFFLTTSASSTQGILNVYKIMFEPLDQTPPTQGAITAGSWLERTDGRGLS